MSDPSQNAQRVPMSLLLAVGCLSAAIIVVELTLTRVFSVTMLYHFAFLAISIAMFGLSAGSVFVYVTPRLHPAEGVGRQLQAYAALFWLVTTASAILLLRMRVRLDYSAGKAFRMIGVYLLAVSSSDPAPAPTPTVRDAYARLTTTSTGTFRRPLTIGRSSSGRRSRARR